MSDKKVNHRKYYRLKYPRSLMPTIRLDDLEYWVSEISEGGMRIRCDALDVFKVGQQVCGEIVFSDGETVEISGVVMRRDQDDIVIAPLKGLSYQRIVLEQRKVLRTIRRDDDLFSLFARG